MPDSLGDRMKRNYEHPARLYLTRRTPVIVRVDGRAFHTFTRDFQKPFSPKLTNAMVESALTVASEMQGCKLGYVQSDEASFLLTDYDELQTQPWFAYNKSKVESISASTMTAAFARHMWVAGISRPATFDARSFNIPEDEVVNYFSWRAKDWRRNSVTMYAQSKYSAKELHNKTCADMHEMLHEVGLNWTTDLTGAEKNGTFIMRGGKRTDVLPTYAAINELWEEVKP
jgi:tRNA(His) 5'-end guanylyltransferase